MFFSITDIVSREKLKIGDYMAFIKCPECSKESSDKATVCINCGCPLESLKYAIKENFLLKCNQIWLLMKA